MQTHVYANNQEIACKAAARDGVSPQAFPDPCWSPPGPAAGPIVIPYPNTCFADSISNGTSTVFICGKEIGIEDQSYFATSTGNEPATQAFKKGVATGVITGKAYFTQWSFDVVFEGFGVPRHMDMVGHNHGSMPSNTPVFPYLSRGWFSHECSDEEKRIERACEKEDDGSDTRKELKKKSKLSALLKAQRSKNGKVSKSRRDGDNWHWTDDHCDGLDVAVNDAAKGLEYAKKMQDAYKSLPEELNLLQGLKSELQDMVANAAGKAALKWGGKAALKQGAGTVLPVAGNIVMGIWSVVDGAMTIGDIAEIKQVATESLEKLDVLQRKLTDLQNVAAEYKDFNQLSDKDKLDKAQRLASDGQDLLATLNDCTRARKCNLVPYQGTKNPMAGSDRQNRSRIEASNSGGCCGGQTGHHLIPKASVEGSCPNYDHGAAPTVCAEGTSQDFGSHGRAHKALATAHENLAKRGKIAPDGTMSMDSALDAAATSHEEAFPMSRCSKKCIRAQLESYYKTCGGGRPRMMNKQSKPAQPDNGP